MGSESRMQLVGSGSIHQKTKRKYKRPLNVTKVITVAKNVYTVENREETQLEG